MTDTNFTIDDTICAISTPPGVGGIAIIRITGPSAIDTVSKIWHGRNLADIPSHTATLGTLTDGSGDIIDRPVATVFRGPHSYTGQDTVEISVHGSIWIQQQTLKALINAGARLASKGEFTRRAYANGRLDLAEAEAVADLISASSRASHRMAMSQMRGSLSKALCTIRGQLLDLASLLELELDFSEEDVEFASRDKLKDLSTSLHKTISNMADSFEAGNAIKNGIPVALAGRTNVGKSTILNLLLNDDKAIISDIHGTTRDIIEDTITINGVLYRIIDTAGLRMTDDTVEQLGIRRALDKISKASAIVWILDATSELSDIDESWNSLCHQIEPNTPVIAVINKIDLCQPAPAFENRILQHKPEATIVRHSNKDPETIELLREAITSVTTTPEITENDIIVTNQRHHQALMCADECLLRVIDGLNTMLSADLIAQDLRQVLHHLGEITGEVTTSDILANIFNRFCIGK